MLTAPLSECSKLDSSRLFVATFFGPTFHATNSLFSSKEPASEPVHSVCDSLSCFSAVQPDSS